MRFPVNLYILSRACSQGLRSSFANFEQLLSKHEDSVPAKEHEIVSLLTFVSQVSEHCLFSIDLLDAFVFSYSIPHIGKEFDLLMISEDSVVNIELKSQNMNKKAILNQLQKNHYYLSCLDGKQIEQFVFIAEDRSLEKFSGNALVPCTTDELIGVLSQARERYFGDFDEVFREKRYLVSPINDSQRFISDNYFLTQQQLAIKNEILKKVTLGSLGGACYKITGTAGTGKTLLLFDLAKSIPLGLPVCVVHCGKLQSGHLELNSLQSTFRVVPAKGCEEIALRNYGAIFFDECHRLRLHQFQTIVRKIKTIGLPCFFFLDSNQAMQASEISNEITNKIDEEMPNIICRELSKKIRTNKEIAAFVRRLFSLKGEKRISRFNNIEIMYADNFSEAKGIIGAYKAKGYQYIYYTPSQYNRWNSDMWGGIPDGYSTHDVVGQEFDKVIMPMDRNFFFESGKLKSYTHPYPEYILPRMLFQGLTRTRDRLAILVYDNPSLFKELLEVVMRP